MPSKTATLALEGDVLIGDLADAFAGFRRLIEALSKEVAPGVEIDWTIDSLEGGSALATVRGEAKVPDVVEEVTAAYLAVGQAEAQHAPVPYTAVVRKAVSAITGVLNSRVSAVRFETADGEATIRSPEA